MKISIVTVCFNSGQTIAKTLKSIGNQTYQNLELIVVDGGSTDNTIEVVESFEKTVDVFVSEPDEGIYDALNKGVRLASGDIIAILHSNDFFTSTTVLEKVAENFKIIPDLEVLLSSINVVADNDNEILRKYTAKGFKPWMLSFGIMPPHPGSFFRSDVYKRVGLFNTTYRIAGDFDFFVRAFAIERMVYRVVPFVSVSMTTGGASSSGFKSYLGITEEFARSLSVNGVSSSRLLIFLRALFKVSQFRLRSIVRLKLF